MWIQEKIREDLENIEPRWLDKLSRMDALPLEKAVRIAAYLWEGCFQSSNDAWIILCGGLLYKIPPEWLETHIRQVLDRIRIDWNDSFEFYNLCAAVCHMPDVLKTVLAYAEKKITAEHAQEWIPDMREMAGNQERRKLVLEHFEAMDKLEWKL